MTLAVAGGCQSSGSGSSAAADPAPTRAVIASTGNGTSTIYLPTGKGVQTLSTAGGPTCDKCAADAAAYFQGGTLESKCPQCGAIRTTAIGHN
jgi:hypothetical protein